MNVTEHSPCTQFDQIDLLVEIHLQEIDKWILPHPEDLGASH